jgi:ketosteroid isomerase-like protein
MTANPFDTKSFVADFERAWNAKDPQVVISKYYDANVEFTDPTGKVERGTSALAKNLSGWFGAFSEMKISLTQSVQNGNDIALVQQCKGRHTGELEVAPGERVPATNKTAVVDVAEFIRLNNEGKIVRDLNIFDSARLLMQLGLLPGASQTTPTKQSIQR